MGKKEEGEKEIGMKGEMEMRGKRIGEGKKGKEWVSGRKEKKKEIGRARVKEKEQGNKNDE